MYEVVKKFKFKETGHIFDVGDNFPLTGDDLPSKQRLEELASDKNKYKEPFIVKVELVETELQPESVAEVEEIEVTEGGEPDEPQPEPPKPKKAKK